MLAQACRDAGVALVHVSTDYVFDGRGDAALSRETTRPAPRSVYGRTKLAGERAVLAASPEFLVVRTSWVFGRGRNFIAAILDQAAQAPQRRGVRARCASSTTSAGGRPTRSISPTASGGWSKSARAASTMSRTRAWPPGGTWPASASTRRGAATSRSMKISTSELRVDAPRPAWSVLDTRRRQAQGVALRSWQEAVTAYLRSDASPLRGAALEGSES